MHKRGLCRHAVSVCLSVCPVRLSRSWIMSKWINISSNFFSPSGSHTILVFPYQTGWRYYVGDGNPPNGGVECKWGGQKTRLWTNIWLRCIYRSTVLSTVRVANCEKQSRDGQRPASSTPRRPLFAQDDDEVFVTGSTLYAGEEVKPIPGHNPLGHNPRFLLP